MAVLPELWSARDLDEVLAAVDHDHAPYAGGTELVPAMGLGLRRPATTSSGSIILDGWHVTIGAAVTHRRLSDHPAVREHLPTLAAAASRVGNARVRYRRRQPLLR